MDARCMRLRAAVWLNKVLYAFVCYWVSDAALCIGSLNHFRAMLKGENWLEWLLGGGM